MENLSGKQILSDIMTVVKRWSFWQKFLSLVLLPFTISLLIYILISTKIYWFAAVSFIVGIVYFLIALMFNIPDKDFDIKLLGGWISVRKHQDEN